jgi:UDP-N-acetylglucosamine 2-epimerase (non-hydrolysing)
LIGIVGMLERLARTIPIVFPMHPRTKRMIGDAGLSARVEAIHGLRVLDPLGYIDFLRLLTDARAVLTDSGGVQEETTVLGVPCVTMRDNTERPSTTLLGTNVLAGSDPSAAAARCEEAVAGDVRAGSIPPLWDGHAAERIVDDLARFLSASRSAA